MSMPGNQKRENKKIWISYALEPAAAWLLASALARIIHESIRQKP